MTEHVLNMDCKKDFLEIVCSFGWNSQLGLINIPKKEIKSKKLTIFFVNEHFGILYEYDLENKSNKTTFLEGHRNCISSFDVNSDGRWIATVDRGNDSRLMVWNTVDRTPICILHSPLEIGSVIIVKFTTDSKYLMTVSTDINDDELQTVDLWDMALDLKKPTYSTKLEKRFYPVVHVACSYDFPNFYCFTANKVVFFMTLVEKTKTLMITVPKKIPKQGKYNYTQSAYLTDVRQVVTASTKGTVTVWDDLDYSQRKLDTRSPITNDKQHLKILKLDEYPITAIICSKNNIITGNTNGDIGVYDKSLIYIRKVNKYIGIPVTSISLLDPEIFIKEENDETQSQVKVKSKQVKAKSKQVKVKITCPSKSFNKKLEFDISYEKFDPFLISTRNSKIFVIDEADENCFQILEGFEETVITALEVHPTEPYVIVGSATGRLSMYDYQTKELIRNNTDDRGKIKINRLLVGQITSIKYSNNGNFLCYGSVRGLFLFIHPKDLKQVIPDPFDWNPTPVQHITFSKSSSYVAYTYEKFGVYLYGAKLTKVPSKVSLTYYGCVEAHRGIIRSIFLEEHDVNKLTIYSVGAERQIVMIDFDETQADGNQFKFVKRMETESPSDPLCMIRIAGIDENDVNFMMSGSDFHLTVWNNIRCIRTNNVANLKSPISALKDSHVHPKHLFFCNDTDIGILQLPFDGNPCKSSAVLCTGTKVTDFSIAPHSQFVFSISKDSTSMLMWSFKIEKKTEPQTKLEAYSSLLNGGENGEEIKRMKKFFYTVQILNSENPATTVFVDFLDVSRICLVMGAMGFFPTESEIDNITYEVLTRSETEIGHPNRLVTFEELVILYLNHKPTLPLTYAEIGEMFNTMVLNDPFGSKEEDNKTLSRETLVHLMTSLGDKMSYRELEIHFRTLLRKFEGLKSESNLETVLAVLPPTFTLKEMITELFGFSTYRE